MEDLGSTANKYDWQEPLDKLTETLRRNERRFELVRQLDREIQKSTDNPKRVFEFLLNEGLKEVGADYGHIMVKSNNKLEIKYSNQESLIGKEIPLKNSLCGMVLESRKFEYIYDVNKKKKQKYHPLHEDTKSELAMPTIDFRGVKVFGILNIEWITKTQITDEDLKFCELLNGQLAIAMGQIKLWEGVQLISELSNELLVNIKSPEEVYKLILERILKILNFDEGQILLGDNEELVIVASSNDEDINVVVGRDNSVCGYYIFEEKGKTPLPLNDVLNSKYKDKYQASYGKDKEVGSEFVFPLIGSDSNTIGAINIEDPRINAFSEFEVYIIGIFGKMIASMIEASNGRKQIRDIESAKDFDIIFAQMGHLSMGFLHNFGGAVGNAKARLAEFKRKIKHLDKSLPGFSNMSGLEFIESILQNLRDSENLIKSFRDKLRPENARTDKRRVDLIVSIQDAICRAEAKIPANISTKFVKDISIEKRRSVDTFLTQHFDEVLDLLLNNAMEAMPEGGDIEVGLKLTGLFTAEIYIKDTGIGMDKSTLDKIFDFGFTTKNSLTSRKGQGLGLWLAIIYLHRFGAKLTVKSKQGRGTTFYITIPTVILDTPNPSN